jgi:hypothetical protein
MRRRFTSSVSVSWELAHSQGTVESSCSVSLEDAMPATRQTVSHYKIIEKLGDEMAAQSRGVGTQP